MLSLLVNRCPSQDLRGLRLARAGVSRDYLPFVVLTNCRSGSNWLADLLGSHPQIVFWNEIFRKAHIIDRSHWWEHPNFETGSPIGS